MPCHELAISQVLLGQEREFEATLSPPLTQKVHKRLSVFRNHQRLCLVSKLYVRNMKSSSGSFHRFPHYVFSPFLFLTPLLTPLITKERNILGQRKLIIKTPTFHAFRLTIHIQTTNPSPKTLWKPEPPPRQWSFNETISSSITLYS